MQIMFTDQNEKKKPGKWVCLFKLKNTKKSAKEKLFIPKNCECIALSLYVCFCSVVSLVSFVMAFFLGQSFTCNRKTKVTNAQNMGPELWLIYAASSVIGNDI